MKKILVSGSIANDYIMNFHDQFGNYILPEKTHQLSVNFNINELHVHAGGAGANICYNLGLLEQESVLLGAVGKEYQPGELLKQWTDLRYTLISETLHTAAAHIMTDEKNNQITAFYPGALLESGNQSLPEGEYSYAIISPNLPETMCMHIKEAAERGIPVFFDPGQPLSAFSKEQLLEILHHATYLIVNEYESDLLLKMTDLSADELSTYVQARVVTLGSKGSRYVSTTETFEVPSVPTQGVVDPTGAGDAFRAGLLYSLHHGASWKEGMELGSKMAHACIQVHGTQRHVLDQTLFV